MTGITVSLVALASWGQIYNASSAYVTPAPTGYSAAFDSLYKDFGTVPQGSQSVHRFTFTNKTDKDIHVLGVRSSCHCATPRAVNDVAKPGEKIVIEVIYDAGKFLGERSMTITVDMQSDRLEQVFLRVRGYSRSDVMLSPGKADLGIVKIGQEQTQTLRLTYSGGQDWRIQEVIPGQWAKATVAEKSRGYGSAEYEVTLNVPANAPRGNFADAVQLKTNDATQPVVRVDVVGMIDGGIQPSLSVVKFDQIEAGKSAKKRFFIKGDRPFTIARADFDAAKLPVALQSTQGEKTVHTLEVEINPTKPGRFEGEVMIRVEPQAELVPIKVVADAK